MNAPTPKDIRLALERRLFSVLQRHDIKLSQPNTAFDPKKLKMWARARTVLGKATSLEKGEQPLGSRTGVFIAQLFLQPSSNTTSCEDICAEVEASFRLADLGDVHCEEPYTSEVGLDAEDSWYQFNVTVPFWAWVGT